jgi:hypothetical protein
LTGGAMSRLYRKVLKSDYHSRAVFFIQRRGRCHCEERSDDAISYIWRVSLLTVFHSSIPIDFSRLYGMIYFQQEIRPVLKYNNYSAVMSCRNKYTVSRKALKSDISVTLTIPQVCCIII